MPADAHAAAEQAVALACPTCNAKLRLTRQLHGKKVHCTKCATALTVSADPWSLLVVGVPLAAASQRSMSSQPSSLPVGMPPMPDGNGAFNFLDKTVDGPAVPNAITRAAQRLNLTEMFGKGKGNHLSATSG